MRAFRRLLRGVAYPVCLALVACVVLVGCGGNDENGGKADVIGTVADDSTLIGISGAIVRVAGIVAKPTDALGAFSILAAPTGTRRMTIVRDGYETITTDVSLGVGLNDLGVVYIRPVATPGLAHIAGVVKESGVPVAGAQVTGGGKTAYTKNDGTFALYNLTPGFVQVQARSGAKSGAVNVTLVSGMTTSVTISISVRPPDPPVI